MEKRKLDNYLSEAIILATKKHKGQYDKANKPYILHPLRVMNKISCNDEIQELKAKIGAVLHDVIEDTDVTKEFLLKEGFPEDIVEAIVLVTKEEGYNKKDYFTRIKYNNLAKLIKLSDLEDNMDLNRLDKVTEKDYNRTKKYRKQYKYLIGELPISKID